MRRLDVSRLVLACAFALSLPCCKSATEKESERLMPAVEALVATVPTTDPKEFVRTAAGYVDTLKKLEAALRDGPHPPPGTPAAQKLVPAEKWVAAARDAETALAAEFQKALS